MEWVIVGVAAVACIATGIGCFFWGQAGSWQEGYEVGRNEQYELNREALRTQRDLVVAAKTRADEANAELAALRAKLESELGERGARWLQQHG